MASRVPEFGRQAQTTQIRHWIKGTNLACVCTYVAKPKRINVIEFCFAGSVR